MARLTRFKGLGYRMDAPGLWRFVDLDTDCAIGAQYRTMAEFLADLASFSAERGFE